VALGLQLALGLLTAHLAASFDEPNLFFCLCLWFSSGPAGALGKGAGRPAQQPRPAPPPAVPRPGRPQATSLLGMSVCGVGDEGLPSDLARKGARTQAPTAARTSVMATPPTAAAPPATPDGRKCRLCSNADNSDDPTASGEYRKWGYPPKQGKTQGQFCYYCLRVFNARYSVKMNCKAGLGSAFPSRLELF